MTIREWIDVQRALLWRVLHHRMDHRDVLPMTMKNTLIALLAVAALGADYPPDMLYGVPRLEPEPIVWQNTSATNAFPWDLRGITFLVVDRDVATNWTDHTQGDRELGLVVTNHVLRLTYNGRTNQFTLQTDESDRHVWRTNEMTITITNTIVPWTIDLNVSPAVITYPRRNEPPDEPVRGGDDPARLEPVAPAATTASRRVHAALRVGQRTGSSCALLGQPGSLVLVGRCGWARHGHEFVAFSHRAPHLNAPPFLLSTPP